MVLGPQIPPIDSEEHEPACHFLWRSLYSTGHGYQLCKLAPDRFHISILGKEEKIRLVVKGMYPGIACTKPMWEQGLIRVTVQLRLERCARRGHSFVCGVHLFGTGFAWCKVGVVG